MNSPSTSDSFEVAYRELEALYGSVPAGLCLLDRELRYVRINDALARMNGHPPADHIGRTLPEMLPGFSRKLIALLRGVIETGEPILGFELSGVNAAMPGVKRWWQSSVVPVRHADGAVIGLSVLVEDISRFKEIEWGLQERLRFETLLSEFSAAFIRLPAQEVDGAIEAWLRRLVAFLDVDRSTVAQFMAGDRELRVTHAWSRPEVPVFPPVRQDRQFPWYAERVRRGELIVLNRLLEDLPPEAVAERRYGERYGLKSHLCVSFTVGGSSVGCIAFGSFREERQWPRDLFPRLRVLGDVLANALVRTHAKLELQQSEAMKGAVLGSLKGLLAVVDGRGTIVTTNDAWMHMACEGCLGPSPGMGPGWNYLEVCEKASAKGDEDAGRALAGMRSVLDGSVDHFDMEYSCPSPSQVRWFDMSVTPFRGEGGGAVILHTDITERKRAELALRESEERFRRMADAAPVLVWMSGPDKGCEYFNKGWLDFRGRTPEEEMGDGWAEGVHPEDLDRCLATYVTAFDAREPFTMVYRLRRHDGEHRWILDTGVPRFDADGTFAGYIGSCVDITEQEHAREALRELSGHLIRAQERERSRIARELHDDFNQRLALLAVELEILAGREVPGEIREALRVLSGRVKELSSDVHQLSRRLHPTKIDQLGLVPAVRGLCAEISGPTGLRAVFSHRDVPKQVPWEAAICLYRIVQEALRNAAKHSGAGEARVELSGEPGAIRLVVADAGSGFDPRSALSRGGLGFVSMRERLRLVGGDVAIRSRPGRGTRIEARVPLAPAEAADSLREAAEAGERP